MADILKIVANPEAAAPDLRSVAQCLRNLADTIDRGECGEVLRAAVDAARMAGVKSVQDQTAVIVRAALELLEAVEGCEAFPPEKMAAFRRVFGA